MSAVTINFGGTLGFAYSPSCVKVSVGTVVTFSGAFGSHPLVGGVIANGTATPAASGSTPLPTTVGGLGTGMSAAFTMQPAGTYGFYCNFHGVSNGMKGAIFVQ